MSKLQKLTFAFSVLLLLIAIASPASAQGLLGCTTLRFVGSYTRTTAFSDLWGDGSNVAHTFVLQLNLHIDGSATQEFSGAPDVMLSGGTITPYVGSWKCRLDGKLVVTLINSTYFPTTDAKNHPATVPAPPPVDLFLVDSRRTTYLFTVPDNNTLTRIQARQRVYGPAEDPSDPTAGTLQPLSTTVYTYKRVVASEADLLAP